MQRVSPLCADKCKRGKPNGINDKKISLNFIKIIIKDDGRYDPQNNRKEIAVVGQIYRGPVQHDFANCPAP